MDFHSENYLESVYKVRIKLSVIPRLDRGIQCFQWFMDPPVKPEDDRTLLYTQTLFSVNLHTSFRFHQARLQEGAIINIILLPDISPDGKGRPKIGSHFMITARLRGKNNRLNFFDIRKSFFIEYRFIRFNINDFTDELRMQSDL